MILAKFLQSLDEEKIINSNQGIFEKY